MKRGTKTTFCLMDTDRVQPTLTGSPPTRITPSAARPSKASPSVGATPTDITWRTSGSTWGWEVTSRMVNTS